MEKNITIKRVVNATLHIDNQSNTESEYDISSDVNISEDNLLSFFNGSVSLRGNEGDPWSASFYANGESNLSVSYQSVIPENQIAIHQAILDFLSDTKRQIGITELISI